MSGDVQPRKRKDKKKKREDDETKEQHQGVHQTKMGEDDVHLHVHSDHGTGGHWCAKIFFFALLALLLGLTGLIILENQGQDDIDTPLSESRFSNYFEGWVDEHRQDDHAHDPVIASIEEHEEEHDDEPFDEEEDHSELEDSHNDDEHDEHDEEEDDHDDEEAEDDEEEEEATEEVTQEDDDDQTQEDEENTQEDDGEDEEDDEEETATQEQSQENDEGYDDEATAEEDDDDDGGKTNEDDDEDNDDVFDEHEPSKSIESQETVECKECSMLSKEVPLETIEIEETSRSFEEHSLPVLDIHEEPEQASLPEPAHEEENISLPEPVHEEENLSLPDPIQEVSKEEQKPIPVPVKQDDEDNEDDEDDDVVDESNPKVVDNDAEELELLKEKARQQEDDEEGGDDEDDDDEDKNASSSIYVKLLIGVALALVARFVIFKRNQTSPDDEVSTEALMKRRLTIAPTEDIPEEGPGPEDEFSEEEIEIEEEIIIDEGDDSSAVLRKIVPESYKELENLYRQAASPVKNIPQQVFKPPPTVPMQQFVRPVQAQAPVAKPLPPPPPQPVRKAPEPVKVEPPREPSPDEEILDYEEEEIEYEEEYEEEEVEEEMEVESDVDDEELMRRLDSKYGTLPNRDYNSEEEDESQWQKVRGGGAQNFDDDDEDDDIFEREFRRAQEHLNHQKYQEAFEIFDRLTIQDPERPKAFLGKAKSLDALAELHQSNVYLKDALTAFKRFLAFEEELGDEDFISASERCAERMQFLGHFMDAVNIQKSLIERFPNVSDYRNQLAISYLSVNRLPEAKRVLHETLLKWRKNGVALVHYGFVCKALDKNCNTAVMYLKEGIETGEEGTQDARFYFNLGDCLQRLGRNEEAKEVFKSGAEKKLFLSEYQRSLYNVESLKAQPFWTKKETTYDKALNELERNWQNIKEEGLNALRAKGLFQNETENLRDFGDWKQFDLFLRGTKNKENCARAPITCGIIESFPEARLCKRGQVKFSVMHPGTHVWPHCGPTNCRLRAHLGLVVPEGTRIRVAEEERSWEEGKVLIFDDSFEHEVWHTGSSLRLVLIVDIWHPDLTKEQRLSLSPI